MAENGQDLRGGFLGEQGVRQKEERSVAPWLVAGGLVVVIVGVLIAVSLHTKRGAAMSDAYASQLAISDLELSQSSNIAGSQMTYVDGQIKNNGSETVSGVQVGTTFHDGNGQAIQTEAGTLSLIRTRTPYIDIEPVSADPIRPGETKPFRLIFEHVPDAWDEKNPQIRIASVQAR